MKFSKSFLAIFLCFLLCLGISALACCASTLPEDSSLVPQEEFQTILDAFEPEISYIEQTHFVTIDTLTPDTLALIKEEAILNLENDSFRFAPLMDAISIAMLREQNHQTSTRAGNGYVIINETYTTVLSYQALKGRHIVDAPVGSSYTYSDSTSVSISSGELIAGFKLTAETSKTVSYSVTGPTDGTTLSNGKIATHRTAIAVLFGSISRYEFDIVSNGVITHATQYVITPGTEAALPYTFLTNIGLPTYADSPNATSWVIPYENPTAFYNAIESNPQTLIF